MVHGLDREIFGVARDLTISILHKPGGVVARVSPRRDGSRYFVKVKHAQPALNADASGVARSVAREAAILQALERAAPSRVRVPRLLFVDPDRGVLATSEVTGERPSDRYPVGVRWLGVGALDRDVDRIGRALRALHETDVRCETVSAAECVRRFASHVAHPSLPLSARIRARLPGAVGDLEDALARPASLVTCHNDFTLDNVVLHAAGVGILDLESVTRDRAERDIADFFVSLREFVPIALAPAIRPARLWAAFFRGYGRSIDAASMRPFILQLAVEHLIDLAVTRWRPGWLRRVHRALMIRADLALLERVLR